jgi:predicted glycosyltransferase
MSKFTNNEWELDLSGITHEILDNGSLNDINVNKEEAKKLAKKVMDAPSYERDLHEMDDFIGDKVTRYYDILWKTIGMVMK